MNLQDPNILPMNIGLAPEPKAQGETLILAGSPAGKTYEGPSRLVFANGSSINAKPEVTSDLIDVRGESLNSLTWPTFLAWRKTKCRPFDYTNGPGMATSTVTAGTGIPFPNRDRAIDEIDQGTLEFIGEVAELGELFQENGPTTFFGNVRDKLIDECGDIFFCGAWALDAWGSNPLSEMDDLELVRITEESELAGFARVLASYPMDAVLKNVQFVVGLGNVVTNFMMSAHTNAGLTANAFKKLKYQRREQNVEDQVGRIMLTLIAVNEILIVANSSVEEALKVNMRKLDARYPNGYQAGQGGGIRVGEGK